MGGAFPADKDLMHICGAGAEPFTLMRFGCIRPALDPAHPPKVALGDAAEAHH